MDTQRIPSQQIKVGPIDEVISNLELAGSVLIVGSQRSVDLVGWKDVVEDAHIFDGSSAHNPQSVVGGARDAASAAQADVVVAIGSGAAIDLGKAVVEHHPAKLIAAPTTLGGSEMTLVYGSRHEDGTKRGGGGHTLLPSVVCYDPQLLDSLPGPTLAASGINAWAHSIEAHYGRRRHWIGKTCAQRTGTILPDLLDRAGSGDRSPQLHERLFQAACLAGFALNVCGMGLHHAICHVLGGLTGIGHAALNVAVLPAAVQTNSHLSPSVVAATLGDMNITDVGAQIKRLGTRFELPTTLNELGVTKAQLKEALPAVMAASHLKNNPAAPAASDVEQTLAAAFTGSALSD